MKRRDFLASIGLVTLAATLPGRLAFADNKKKAKILYYTRSASFQHDPVKLEADGASISDKALIKWGKKNNIEFVCTKDGTVFDGDLGQFDGFAFYTSGDLLAEKATDGSKPMSAVGKGRFLKAIEDGKGFVGYHSATDTWKTDGPAFENQENVDAYIRMIGGEFIRHDAQQEAAMLISKPVDLPFLKDKGDSFRLFEEWYASKNFNNDIHVILTQETKGMEGDSYQRPPFPATWARMQGKGRVAYTSIGHRNELWNDDAEGNFVQFFGELIEWSIGRFDMDVTPNLKKVTPGAFTLKQ